MVLNRRRVLWVGLSTVMVWVILACIQPASARSDTLINEPTPTVKISPITGYLPAPNTINPLTGIEVEQPKNLERRPVMVKISNYPPSVRPQAGLSFADLVFEYYIGEGMNRFLGLFYGQDSIRAGSIRSGRLVDAQIVPMYQAILVYGSADPRVDDVIEERLGKRAISHLEVGCPIICGAPDTHLAPWIYVDTAAISHYASTHEVENKKHNLSGMLFDSSIPQESSLVVRLGVEYSSFNRGEWHFNPATAQYERWQETDLSREKMSPLVDQLNNQPIAYANIVIIFSKYIEFNPTLHEIEIWKNTEGAPAIFFRDGVMSEGYWQAISQDRPIQFFNRQGLPYGLKPGSTWVVIANTSSRFEQVKPGEWDLSFELP